jgi:hypothetical protein
MAIFDLMNIYMTMYISYKKIIVKDFHRRILLLMQPGVIDF